MNNFNLNNFYRSIGVSKRSSFNLKRRLLRRKRISKGWTWDVVDFNVKGMMNITDKDNLFLGSSDIEDYIISKLIINRINCGIFNIEHCEFTIICSVNELIELLKNNYPAYQRFILTKDRGIIVDQRNNSWIKFTSSSGSVTIFGSGTESIVNEWYRSLTQIFREVTIKVNWLYSTDGNTVEIPLREDRVPIDQMYPWLGDESLKHYYDRYISSDASILVLIGPPGTGKTTFIRGLLQHTGLSALVTYDPAILAKDYVFAQFIESDMSIMVIEDADNFLGAREDGNDIMHKFLNVGDGLVTTSNKKLIFSTNLPSIRDIDPALVRPGRCFDIVNFDYLSAKDAQTLARSLNTELHDDKDQYSLADVFHKQDHAQQFKKARQFGFI